MRQDSDSHDAAGARKQPEPSDTLRNDGKDQHHRDQQNQYGRTEIQQQVHSNDSGKEKRG
jgi:hypothetical protein